MNNTNHYKFRRRAGSEADLGNRLPGLQRVSRIRFAVALYVNRLVGGLSRKSPRPPYLAEMQVQLTPDPNPELRHLGLNIVPPHVQINPALTSYLHPAHV